MNCIACRGACCESFSLPLSDLRPPDSDTMYWIKLHGTAVATPSGPALSFECRCTALEDGRCAIYEDRPMMCRAYRPGCYACYETVRDRRTPEQYQEIRESGDPLRIHDTTVTEK